MKQNAERNERIIALRDGGSGPRAIARALGLSPQTVVGVLWRAGRTRPLLGIGRGNGYPAAFKRQALRLADEIGAIDAAERLGVSWTTIYEWRRQAGRPDALKVA